MISAIPKLTQPCFRWTTRVQSKGSQQAGYHRLPWEAQDDEGCPLASGIYFYRLETTNGILTRKLTLLR